MNEMMLAVNFLLFTLLCEGLADVQFNPENEGKEKIVNFTLTETNSTPILDWDFLGGERQVIRFEIITDPPFLVSSDGTAHHQKTIEPPARLYGYDDNSEYNVTIRAYSYDSDLEVYSNAISFKSKPKSPEITYAGIGNGTASDFTYTCLARGNPIPSVTVTRNGEPIEAQGIEVSDEIYLITVEFNRTLTMYGTYTCSATNIGGTATKDVEHNYTKKDADVLIKTLNNLRHKTEEIKQDHERRLNKLEETINEMKEAMNDVQELLHNKTREI